MLQLVQVKSNRCLVEARSKSRKYPSRIFLLFSMVFGTFAMRQFLPIGTISAKTTNSGSIVPSLFLQVLSKPVQEVMCGLVLAAGEVWGESAQQKMILLHQLLFDTHLPRRIWHLAFWTRKIGHLAFLTQQSDYSKHSVRQKNYRKRWVDKFT